MNTPVRCLSAVSCFVFACTPAAKLPIDTAVIYLQRDPPACGEGTVVGHKPQYLQIKNAKSEANIAPADVVERQATPVKAGDWVCVFGVPGFTFGKVLDTGSVELGPNRKGKRETLVPPRVQAVPKDWSDVLAQANAGLLLREKAAKLHPPIVKDWEPATNDRVLWRPSPSEPWQAYDILWDPPVAMGVFRELWQPKDVQVLNRAKLEDTYFFLPPDKRPRIEANDYVLCTTIDPNMTSSRSTHLAQALKRNGEMLEVMDEDGGKRRVHGSDCLRLEQ